MPQRASTAEPILAIAYIRVSMAREEMISPELQRAAISDWARRHNREITEWVQDLDATGRNFRRRITYAIDQVREGHAREIVVWKFSRFGRQRVGWAVHLDQLETAGGALHSATEEVDAKTAAGRFARGMLAEVAAFESDRIGEQWQEAHQHRRRHGLPATGGPRWGYQRLGRIALPGEPGHHIPDPTDPLGERYEPDPATAPIYVSLYERYVAGEGSTLLVRWLNSRGITTTRGLPFTIAALFLLLDSGFAAGLLRMHDPECKCGRPGNCRRVIYVAGAQAAIISTELWEQYLDRRAKLRRIAPRARQALYPLSGLMRCAHCAHSVGITNGGTGRKGYGYHCWISAFGRECDGVWIRRVLAEEQVLAQLADILREIEAEASTRPAHAVEVPTVRNETERITAEISRIERALAKLTRMRAMDDDESPAAEAEFKRARDELRAERRQLDEQLQATPPEQTRPAEHAPVIRLLLDQWEVLPVQRRRDLLGTVVARIEVRRSAGPTQPAYARVVPIWEDTE